MSMRPSWILLAGLLWANAALALPLVTVVESYHPENSWDKDYVQGIKSKLDGVAELSFISLDTKRLPTSEHLQQARMALTQIQQQPPALAILGDDAALALLGPKLARMNIPTVFLGINAAPERYFDGGKLPPKVTGVLERPRYKNNFALIRELLPHTRRILVLMDEERSAQILREDIVQLRDEAVEVQLISSLDGWKKAILSAHDNYDAVVIGTYQALVDETYRNVDAGEVMRWSQANSKIPLFGFWDFQIGRNAAVGGVVLTGFEQGAQAGSMAKLQLQRPTLTLPLRYGSNGRVMLSRTQAERWKLTISPALRSRVSWLP